jgi:hypothetical protein
MYHMDCCGFICATRGLRFVPEEFADWQARWAVFDFGT